MSRPSIDSSCHCPCPRPRPRPSSATASTYTCPHRPVGQGLCLWLWLLTLALLVLTVGGKSESQLRIGKAINIFLRYGYLGISMRVIPYNDSAETEQWIFKEPTRSIYKVSRELKIKIPLLSKICVSLLQL